MRIVQEDEYTYDRILRTASETSVQIRKMEDHEPSLEDLFIKIMERLGYGVKSSDELLGQNNSDVKELPFETSNNQRALLGNKEGGF